jgi:ABC-2 type transport system permease protein
MTNINYIGTQSLYLKEVRRFIKVYNQTLIIPVVTALLFLAVFNLALGQNAHSVGNLPFHQFMIPGLVMMGVMQNAFANTSSSFTMGKVMGTIIDYLMPPLSAAEITFAMVMAGVTRGAVVGILVFTATLFFYPLPVYSAGYALFFLLSASMLLASLGLLSGVIAETFDQMAAVNSYVIVPLSFLSGTFYSVHNLPPFWYHVTHFNPFFYMIDGFRYGLTGYHDGDLGIGVGVMLVSNIVIWTVVQTMLTKGYRIKS